MTVTRSNPALLRGPRLFDDAVEQPLGRRVGEREAGQVKAEPDAAGHAVSSGSSSWTMRNRSSTTSVSSVSSNDGSPSCARRSSM